MVVTVSAVTEAEEESTRGMRTRPTCSSGKTGSVSRQLVPSSLFFLLLLQAIVKSNAQAGHARDGSPTAIRSYSKMNPYEAVPYSVLILHRIAKADLTVLSYPGKGSFGEVYKGYSVRTQRAVAIKGEPSDCFSCFCRLDGCPG